MRLKITIKLNNNIAMIIPNLCLPELVSPVLCAVICGVGGAISQIGDLSASAIKRNHEIKDYGKLNNNIAMIIPNLCLPELVSITSYPYRSASVI